MTNMMRLIRSHPYHFISPGVVAVNQKRYKYEDIKNASSLKNRLHVKKELKQKVAKKIYGPGVNQRLVTTGNNKNESNSALSFSHKGVSMDPKEIPNTRVVYTGKHIKIADLMSRIKKSSKIKVFKLRPDVSRDILLRTRLENLLPKKEFQPKVHPRKPYISLESSKHEPLLNRFLEELQKFSDGEKMKKERTVQRMKTAIAKEEISAKKDPSVKKEFLAKNSVPAFSKHWKLVPQKPRKLPNN